MPHGINDIDDIILAAFVYGGLVACLALVVIEACNWIGKDTRHG